MTSSARSLSTTLLLHFTVCLWTIFVADASETPAVVARNVELDVDAEGEFCSPDISIVLCNLDLGKRDGQRRRAIASNSRRNRVWSKTKQREKSSSRATRRTTSTD